MSLINDALKRAAQKPASPPSASDLAADLRPAAERPGGLPVLALLIVLIPLIALGVWFLAKGFQLNEQPEVVPAETVVARVPEPALAVAPVPAVAAPIKPAPAVPTPPTNVYKLQVIYWRPEKPSAVVNGKTVYVGDRVESARVAAIDREGVTLTLDGQSRTLLLP